MPFSQSYQVDYHSEFDFLGAEFVELYKNSNATVFQHPYWLHQMYCALIPKVGVTPIIVTVRDRQSGALKLVLPLVRNNYAGLSCVEPADLGICDYNAVIASKDLEDAFFADDGLRENIMKGLRPVNLIFFRKMRGNCDVVGHVIGDGQVGDMENSAHGVELTAPYDEWKSKTLSSSFRKELRRKHKKLREFGEVSFEILTDETEIRLAMDLMREQRGLRYEDDLFQQSAYFEFYSDIAVAGAQNGLAQTAILKAGHEIVAVEFGLIHDHCYHFILGGLDTYKFGKASPGILVLDFVLQHRVEQGDTHADFTIGDEAYKARFGTTPTQLKHISQAETVMGAVALEAYKRGGVVKKVAKTIANLGNRKSA